MSEFDLSTGLFGELDRLQREMSNLFSGFPSSIRSSRPGAFPPINIGTTDDSVEIVAFAPGMDAKAFDVTIDKGLLTISGERRRFNQAERDAKSYAQERFVGAFRRAIELPTHVDPSNVQARYANGCLCISIGKRESSKPRAISVQ
ncbi:heat-shock protein Hsp20 [Pandoraea eparura]|uniref:Heat-shock protein Hsp20 n=1 Tax=Pandoraea eparura TaxID=2508291 RepID=A0A5E4X742_9BURK|nr:Hsp20/alpha crystallin family protein [Pandoraea eparura]VVE32157.1 heat-shock protein Hsp20 [Pandoraea eparura]